jgi:hypothetical protein
MSGFGALACAGALTIEAAKPNAIIELRILRMCSPLNF